MRIDIFCESGEKYGLGHLKRCENLLEIFKHSLAPLSFRSFFHTPLDPIPHQNYDLVIIDSYIMPQCDYELLAKQSRALICIDDFNRVKYPKNALVLSPTYKHHHRFSGKDYIIIHPVFQSNFKQNPIKNQILITLGGSNQNKLIEEILKALPPHLNPQIISPTFISPQTHFDLSAQQICDLIDQSEIIISAGGGSLNEAISRNKKIIALCIAKNQKNQLNAYKKTIPVIFNPFNQLDSKLNSLLPFVQNTKCFFGSKLPKLAQIFLHQALKLPSNIKPFFLLNRYEKKQVLKLRNQKEVRNASFDSSKITLKNHMRFLNSLKPHQMYFAFFWNKQIIGVGSLHILSSTKAKIGIYKNMKIKKIGTKILKSLIDIAHKLGIFEIELEVLKKNRHAIALYQKNNFQEIQIFQHYILMQYKGLL